MFQNHDFRFRQELEFAAREKKHPTGIDILSMLSFAAVKLILMHGNIQTLSSKNFDL